MDHKKCFNLAFLNNKWALALPRRLLEKQAQAKKKRHSIFSANTHSEPDSGKVECTDSVNGNCSRQANQALGAYPSLINAIVFNATSSLLIKKKKKNRKAKKISNVKTINDVMSWNELHIFWLWDWKLALSGGLNGTPSKRMHCKVGQIMMLEVGHTYCQLTAHSSIVFSGVAMRRCIAPIGMNKNGGKTKSISCLQSTSTSHLKRQCQQRQTWKSIVYYSQPAFICHFPDEIKIKTFQCSTWLNVIN